MLIRYKPSFVREFKKLPPELQEEALEKIERFRDLNHHAKLRVHKLKGKLRDFFSFSITYSHRVVFTYEAENEVVFIAIGDHTIYK